MADELTVVELIKGAIAITIDRKEAALLYVGALTVLGTIIEWSSPNIDGSFIASFKILSALPNVTDIGEWIGLLGTFFLALMAQYLLWETMLQRPPHLPDIGGKRFFAFFGQQILVLLGFALGLVLLILPGLIFLARWSTAPAFLIEERMGLIDSLRSSWNQMRGNATPVVLIFIALGMVYLIAGWVTGAMQAEWGTDTGSLPLIFVGHLLSNVEAALLIAVGAFLFNRLDGRTRTLSGVFE